MAINWDDFQETDAPSGTSTVDQPEIDWSQFEPVKTPTTAEGLPRFQTPKGIVPPTLLELSKSAAQIGEEESPTPTLAMATKPLPAYLPESLRPAARKIVGTLGGGLIGSVADVVSEIAPKSKAGQIAKGVSEAQTDNAEFFLSPLGIATLGIGGLPKIAQRAVSLAFAAQMASQTPELSRQLGDELGKPSDQRDPEKIAKLVAQGITTTGFTAGAGVHGLAPAARPRPTVSETTPPVPPAEMPKTPTESGFYPAIRLVGGETVVGEAGQTHPDIIDENKLTAKDIDQRGFVNQDGVFSDREQTAAATGLPTEQEPQRQHSTDLPETEKGEPNEKTMEANPEAAAAATPELPDWARRKLASKVKSELAKPYATGTKDALAGRKLEDNPYVEGSTEAAAWESGWKSTKEKGEPSASEIETPTEIHGNVQPFEQPAQPSPIEESGGGIQPQTERGIQEGQAPSPVLLKPPYKATVYQGRGASLENIYGPEAVKAGRAVPILGNADYFTPSAEDAKIYGKVTKHEVELKNPIVIDSDNAWRQLLKSADTTVLDSRGREWHEHPERIAGAGKKLQEYLRSQGYDGAIVRVPMGDMNEKGESIKGLAESFGHDQVIRFKPTKPAAPAKAATKIQKEVQAVAKTEGQRSAKEVKSELVQRLEKAIEDAPKAADVEEKTGTRTNAKGYSESYVIQPDKRTKVTIDIPGDGVFTVWNTKENLTQLRDRAKAIKTGAVKTVKESKPAGGIPPDVFVQSSEPTHNVFSAQKGGKSASRKGKQVELTTPNAKGLKFWLTSDGDSYSIIEESTGLRIAESAPKASTAIKEAGEKLDELAKTKPIPDLIKEKISAGIVAKPPEPLRSTGEARPITDEGAMQSGPALGIDEFVKQDVAPFLKKGVDAGKALVDIMVDVFSPASRTADRDVDELFQGKGFREKIITRATDALTASGAMFDRLSEPEQIAFVDRVKRGQRQPTPELQKVADLMRKWDDRLFVMAKRYKPGLPYLENHNRVLWKVVPGSPEARGMSKLGVRSKRPWQGSKGFLRRHVLDDMSQGIELGGVPVTYNPVDMFLLHAQDVMKFVAANRAWEGLKKTGSVEWVKTGQKPPDGYVRISDNISKPYFRTPTGLLAKTGEWYVEQGAARMIKNYLSRDYIRTGKFGPVGRAMLALKNVTTAIELGLSPFHAVFESNEVMGSSIGLGIAKLASGKLSGVKDILGAPFSPKTTSTLGKAGIQFAKNPAEFARVYPDAYKWFTTKYPEARKLINDLFGGGGQPGMNEDYRVNGIKGFNKAVAEGNYPGAVIRAFPAMNELAMKPLFQTYIPRLKVGMFLREYSFELERNSDRLASAQITRPELARKTWAFIEDRFGELNFDNLYWDRTFKSAMQILFRSVTWKLGNLRGFGKASRDLWTEGLKPLMKGEKPRITLPVAWLGGMALVTAVQASIISKVSTGKYPWELAKDAKDMLRNLVFPRIDPDDEKQRVSVPTYWRDLVHLAHSPVGYVGSSMTGEWRRLYDDLVNRDFYRHPIYNPNDPLQKKVVASLAHLVPLPFGASSFIGATKEGVGPERAAAGFMGFTKAPSYVSPTSQTQLRDLAMKWKSESKIPQLVREAQRQATEQFEPSDYGLLRSALRNRNYPAARKALDKLIEEGHKPKDIAQAMRPLNKEGRPRPFTGSQLQEKYFVRSLTPEQKQLYRDSVRERVQLYQRFVEMLKQPKTND